MHKYGGQAAFGDVVGASQSTVSSWLSESAIPAPQYRLAIEALTGIPPGDWMSAREREIVARAVAAREGEADIVRDGRARQGIDELVYGWLIIPLTDDELDSRYRRQLRTKEACFGPKLRLQMQGRITKSTDGRWRRTA